MSKLGADRTCAFCAHTGLLEDDHVIARQFFPNELIYRDNLPQVPACGKCNREKQKYEDSAAVILQFAHNSDASRKVLDDRVRRTLAKNARISRALQSGMHKAWIRDKSGLLLERLVIDINEEELFYINQWFRFVTKGLYYFEMKEPLPKGYDIYLLKPAIQEEFDSWANFLLKTENCQERQVANGEFRYVYSNNTEDKALSMWLFVFKSVEVFAFTVSEDSPDSLRSSLKESAWRVSIPKLGKKNRMYRWRIIAAMQLQEQFKSPRFLRRDEVSLAVAARIAFLAHAFNILLFLLIFSIICLSAQGRRPSRNTLFGVPLNRGAKALLAEVEQTFGKPVREEWMKEDNSLAAVSGTSKVDDDGTPVISINPANGRKLDVIVHELYHFKLRAEGYPVILWLYPNYMDTEANRAALNQLNEQLHDPILHFIFYSKMRAWGINPGESFESRTKQALKDGSLATTFTSMDRKAVGLYYFKIRLEVDDLVLLQRLENLLESKQKQSGIELGKRLSQMVIESNPRSPEDDIKTVVDCLNAFYEGEFHFKQHSWTFRQLGKHKQQVAQIEMQPLQ